MNKTEAAKILATLQLNYPDSFKNMSTETLQGLVNLWSRVLVDDSYADVSAAVMAHISTDTGRFMPPVGVIKNMLVKIREPEQLTEMQAWALVAEATRHSTYHAQEEFEKLPPTIQRVIGNSNTLREWAMMDADTVNSVIQSNFMRSYRAKIKHETEQKALPSTVKEYMLQLSGCMNLEKAIAAKGEFETEE